MAGKMTSRVSTQAIDHIFTVCILAIDYIDKRTKIFDATNFLVDIWDVLDSTVIFGYDEDVWVMSSPLYARSGSNQGRKSEDVGRNLEIGKAGFSRRIRPRCVHGHSTEE